MATRIKIFITVFIFLLPRESALSNQNFQWEFHQTHELHFSSNWTLPIITSDNQLRIVFSTQLALHCLSLNGDTLWSIPALGIHDHRGIYLKSDYLLAYRSKINQDSIETLELIDVRKGKIVDTIHILRENNEIRTEILWIDPYYFIHFNRNVPNDFTKRFVVLDIRKGRIKKIGEFHTSGWIANYVYDFKNDFFLFSSLSSCNMARSIQGVSDCTGGLYLTSLDSWKIINRVVPLAQGYLGTDFLLHDNEIYAITFAGAFNEIPYMELNILKYPSLQVIKRRVLISFKGECPTIIEQNGQIMFIIFNTEDKELYLFNSQLQIEKSIHIPYLKEPPQKKMKRTIMEINYKFITGDYNQDGKKEILIVEKIWKRPKDPRGTLRDRYGRRPSTYHLFVLDDQLHLRNRGIISSSQRARGVHYISELNQFIFLSKEGIKLFNIQ